MLCEPWGAGLYCEGGGWEDGGGSGHTEMRWDNQGRESLARWEVTPLRGLLGVEERISLLREERNVLKGEFSGGVRF